MIGVLVGTRPEIIKMAPVLRKLTVEKVPHLFIHSNQHYSHEMDAQIIADLGLRSPDFQLHVGSESHAVQTGKIMERVEKICVENDLKILVVHGDTNTTLGGALAVKKLHVKIAHVEAGLRSHDYRMPEEINRILTDRISDILFAPTEGARQNLLKEGIVDKTISVTGNTVVDALYEHQVLATRSEIRKKYTLLPQKYILVTAHRAENVDELVTLKALLLLLDHATKKVGHPIFWPMHPRTQKRLKDFNLKLPTQMITAPPIGYLDMIDVMTHASLILTDSGGIQEEAYILKKPLMTLRDSTERPETLSANFIIHTNCGKFDQAWEKYQQKQTTWSNELGTGKASQKIVDILIKNLK